MRKEDAIKKYREFGKKHVLEATAVHEAGHMMIAKSLFPEQEWNYGISKNGEPMVDGPGQLKYSTANEIVDIVRYCIAGVVNEANWLGLGDYVMDILKWTLEDEKQFAENNECGAGDCTKVEELMAEYKEWFGRDFNLAVEARSVLATLRHKANKQACMAEVHAAKRYFQDKNLEYVEH